MHIRNAKWVEIKANETGRQAWAGYRIRNRGSAGAYSRDGVCWFTAWGVAISRPSKLIRFHGGPLDGMVR